MTVVRNPAARPDRTTEGPPTSAATIVVTSSEERVTLPDSLRGVIPGWEVQTLGDEGALIQVRTDGGKPTVLLAGKTTAGACYAVYSFLENELGVGFFIDGDRVPQLEALELTERKRTEIPRVPIRGLFYHSVWKAPHANNWRLWGFEEWKQFIDWMRHRRMNVLPLFHDEGGYLWGDILFREFPEIERNSETLRSFVIDPGYRTSLNQKIFYYARRSGVQIAYNLFYSQVPKFFASYYPDLEYQELLMENFGISARQPECREIMRRYWKAILDTYGVDSSHIYIVCPYQHEGSLPDYFPNRNPPTLQTAELLKELDPEARIYVETWCWKYHHPDPRGIEAFPVRPTRKRSDWLTENITGEWEVFNQEMPPDIGVAEWDNKKDSERIPDPTFGGRPYIQVTHTNMEGWWPPSTSRRHPQWVMDYFDDAIRNGAEGVMSFHIQADTNPLLADLTAEIGWKKLDLEEYLRDYSGRRFGEETAGQMAQSLAAFLTAVDLRVQGPEMDLRWTHADPSLIFTLPGARGSAEGQLESLEATGAERTKWIEDRLALMEQSGEWTAQARQLEQSATAGQENDPFVKDYRWELDYLAYRIEGATSMYRAHLMVGSAPVQSEEQFQRAMDAFPKVRNLFRDRPRYHMSKLQEIEPDVPYTEAFLTDWEWRGHRYPDVKWFHIVWERLDEFEEKLRRMKPE